MIVYMPESRLCVCMQVYVPLSTPAAAFHTDSAPTRDDVLNPDDTFCCIRCTENYVRFRPKDVWIQ